ncbi:ATP-dependent zinc metalloprotease FtsH [Sphaerobacter thermophilus]|uniref:ATP-dependent zinc metalloprotease FtsH 1 n=1 Tax=Sphaerobacter thermophilus (strain ATCC 49802 / DSM 20745 / KCCM 41009 / NCIMB 13125 / S 6022) TaxID=479434 RepID=FTSH1_SPHTD|nr:ATP-dependent zinc metalloprotease FtsH [Sphaerobacter thermophilus]D1C1U7.1 RecName: Full=ATP-dependent zinc metalloprotease FtsH 1 [Sphaerobacter thermophilus DSM 20745]ACZ38214.1 ATP-dependent metalloprotease FtsH [Sphaerobacter thermophilus DSM 20745]PZN67592.1 MAG: ATP-dependent zinc metalloprotease FtsH 1 [Sphaerobacter thermophilus]
MAENKWLRNGFVWIVLIIAVVALWVTFMKDGGSAREENFADVAADIRQGRVARIVMTEGSNDIQVQYIGEEEPRSSRLPPDVNIYQALEQYGLSGADVEIRVNPASQWGNWLSALTFILPTLFLIGIVIFMMRQAQGTNNQAISFGKSRARMFTGNKPTVTFADVAGVEEAKEELVEVVEFLKYPDKFASLGARIPRGVLLVGPPGTGKTLLSRAVAGEAGVPFFSISGSEFVEMFVGVGASRVRDLFDQAKRNAPCIVFIDEIDAVGRQRGAGLGGSHDEREQTLNQILVEMDGFDSTTNVIVIAATNRPDVLDPALLRPGRFDRQVVLDRPDIAGRRAILEVHSRGKPLESDVDLEELARQTPGFSGADLENLVNEAAILAARRNKKTIGRRELTEAIDRVIAGPERKSRVLSEREKLMTAYHEAGHALVARMLPHADPVHKVSIVARGMMGGYTRVLPEEDRFFWTKKQFEDQLAVFMGGHVAEELVFQEISTGAANDIERATNLARRMVTEYGMSKTLGPLAFGRKEELVFLGREINEQRNYSDEVAYMIDQEIRSLIDTAYKRAHEILSQHMDKLEAIAMLLMEAETIDGHELEALFDEPRPRPQLVGPPVTRPAALAHKTEEADRGGERSPHPQPHPSPTMRPQPAS